MKIAIVGTGISGLVAAHRLHARHEITVYEAAARIGGHTHTVDLELDGERHAVDTGFIVYNEHTYPHFTRLLAELGVATQPTDMSFSVRCERTGLEWGSRGLRGVFAQPANALRRPFVRMLRDVARFDREAPALLERADVSAAKAVGLQVATRAIQAGLKEVVFDRGGYIYHGRVKALADGAREGGLSF